MLKMEAFTLCLIVNSSNDVLMQKRNKPPYFGQWNAPGGKVEKNESFEQACIREVFEETGLVLCDLKFIGSLHFTRDSCLIKAFISDTYRGDVIASHEGELMWIPISQLVNNKESIAFGLDYFLETVKDGRRSDPVSYVF